MLDIEKEIEVDLLTKMNNLMVDIIVTLQDQGKKNQIFLNKALHNINELKRDIQGAGKDTTYNSAGTTKTEVRG